MGCGFSSAYIAIALIFSTWDSWSRLTNLLFQRSFSRQSWTMRPDLLISLGADSLDCMLYLIVCLEFFHALSWVLAIDRSQDASIWARVLSVNEELSKQSCCWFDLRLCSSSCGRCWLLNASVELCSASTNPGNVPELRVEFGQHLARNDGFAIVRYDSKGSRFTFEASLSSAAQADYSSSMIWALSGFRSTSACPCFSRN